MSSSNYFLRNRVLSIFICLAAIPALAQTNYRKLSLEEAITAAVNNNRQVQLANLDLLIAASQYKQTEAIYLPQVGLSYTGMSTNNPLNAFGFKLQQSSITQNDFNPALLNHPLNTPDFTTKLEFQQPIINLDQQYMRKGAEKQIELYQFKKERTKEYIRFETEKAWLQLQLTYQSIIVMEEALATSKAVHVFTDNYFKQGLVQKSDLLTVEVQVSTLENTLAKARTNILTISDFISQLMGSTGGMIYTMEPNSNNTKASLDTSATVSPNRSDFLAMKRAIEASDLMIESKRKTYLPRLNAFGSYQINDSRMLGFGAGAYIAGISLAWDIFKGNTTKNQIFTQTLERNKLTVQLQEQQEQSNTELNKTKRQIADIRFEIIQEENAIEQATEALRILQNRYQQGLVNTTDVMQAATQLSQQKLLLAQAIFNRELTKAYLQFLTTTSIKNN